MMTLSKQELSDINTLLLAWSNEQRLYPAIEMLGKGNYIMHYSLDDLLETIHDRINPRISRKVEKTPYFETLGPLAVYHGIYELILNASSIKTSFFWKTNERGEMYKVIIDDKQFMVKGFQCGHFGEWNVANVAAKNGFGPDVYGPGIEVVEQILPHYEIPTDKYKAGFELGKLLRKCHDSGIIFADRYAKHFHSCEGEPRFIDFGTSFHYDGSRPMQLEAAQWISHWFYETNAPKLNKNSKFLKFHPDKIKEQEFRLFKQELNNVICNSRSFNKGLTDGYSKI
jgi:hypothetical protein